MGDVPVGTQSFTDAFIPALSFHRVTPECKRSRSISQHKRSPSTSLQSASPGDVGDVDPVVGGS